MLCLLPENAADIVYITTVDVRLSENLTYLKITHKQKKFISVFSACNFKTIVRAVFLKGSSCKHTSHVGYVTLTADN